MFRINQEAPVGSIKGQMGWKALFKLDGGRSGEPSLCLVIRANNDVASWDRPVREPEDPRTDNVIFRFRPGVKAGWCSSAYQMEDYETFCYASSSTNDDIFPPAIFGDLTEVQKENLQAFRFRWNGRISIAEGSRFRERTWSLYPKAIRNALARLTQSGGMITIWISWPLNLKEETGKTSFETAFRHRLRPTASTMGKIV